MAKILITGGAGFIGSHIAEALCEKGHEIIILDNFSTGLRENLHCLNGNADVREADIRDRLQIREALIGVDTVFHMAAEVGVERVMRTPEEMWDVEVGGTKTVLEESIKSGVKRFVFASSSETYGFMKTSELPMRESANVFPDTLYGKAKRECEMMCERVCNGIMSTVSIRYFNVYGPRQTCNGYAVPHFMAAAITGELLKVYGDGTQIRDMLFVDDAVDATLRLCDSKETGIFNISTGTGTTMDALARMVIGATNSKSSIIHEPRLRRPTDMHSKIGDSSKIRDALGWSAKTDLKKGLDLTSRHYIWRMLDNEHCGNRGAS